MASPMFTRLPLLVGSKSVMYYISARLQDFPKYDPPRLFFYTWNSAKKKVFAIKIYMDSDNLRFISPDLDQLCLIMQE